MIIRFALDWVSLSYSPQRARPRSRHKIKACIALDLLCIRSLSRRIVIKSGARYINKSAYGLRHFLAMGDAVGGLNERDFECERVIGHLFTAFTFHYAQLSGWSRSKLPPHTSISYKGAKVVNFIGRILDRNLRDEYRKCIKFPEGNSPMFRFRVV